MSATTRASFFKQSELALAAYANLATGRPDEAALRAAGMAASQATRFANNWNVVDQYNDITGLSATVFQDQSGKKYLAFRGTDPSFLDLSADFVLANGFPAQLLSQYRALKAQIQIWTSSRVLPSTFTVTGHSLWRQWRRPALWRFR